MDFLLYKAKSGDEHFLLLLKSKISSLRFIFSIYWAAKADMAVHGFAKPDPPVHDLGFSNQFYPFMRNSVCLRSLVHISTTFILPTPGELSLTSPPFTLILATDDELCNIMGEKNIFIFLPALHNETLYLKLR